MAIKLKLILIIIVLFNAFSCQKNKQESLRYDVLNKFKNDDKKYNSAKFILDNFNNKVHYEGILYNTYLELINKYSNDSLVVLNDSLNKIYNSFKHFMLDYDFNRVTDDYLEYDINMAYNAINKVSWKNSINKMDLNSSIVSYKVNNSKLEYWRDSVYSDFGDLPFKFDSLIEATEYLVNEATDQKKDFKIKETFFPDLPYSSLKRLNYGTCKELSDYMSFILRAYAIPVNKDFTPNYTNIHAGHFWNSIRGENGKVIPFTVPLEVDTLGRFKSESYRLGKVYRRTFVENLNSHASIFGKNNFFEGFLNDEFIKDVTDEYIKTYSISVPVLSRNLDFDVAYLYVFNNKFWTPLAWGTISRNSNKEEVMFEKVGVGSVYLPTLKIENGDYYFNYPFILRENGNIDIKKPNKDSLISLNVFRKYPLTDRIKFFINRMNGGIFQLSNNSDFSNSVDVYTIKNLDDEYFKEVKFDLDKKYQYIRYVGPADSFCNLSELEFYFNDQKLEGNIIGSEGTHPKFKSNTKDKAFDDDVLTFYYAPEPNHSWIGMDFTKPISINKIKFCPRISNNVIIPGNVYELFYWDNRWVSLGVKKAKEKVLKFNNVPSGALYFIKNHSEGKQERIFTYENDKQVWW
ncbi:hypothetical protein [Formosa haliotis]|uniref:hypothetical protein n=1 Tax=Formosa haliotis TaxID=1555194 RepID=UPI0008248D13|nr:hypothetical protein [Formosa haliotis]